MILNERLKVIGTPWRGNLRETINNATNSREWVSHLFSRCKIAPSSSDAKVTLAIDAPLGFSTEFQNLITSRQAHSSIGLSPTNQYLYRKTERLLFERGVARPLSAVKDMIGSQATKAMHVVAKFAHHTQSCGVWTDGQYLTAIEAYPACCQNSALTKNERKKISLDDENNDIQDATTCAVIAHLFRTKRGELRPPDSSVPDSEGWIWLPTDALPR